MLLKSLQYYCIDVVPMPPLLECITWLRGCVWNPYRVRVRVRVMVRVGGTLRTRRVRTTERGRGSICAPLQETRENTRGRREGSCKRAKIVLNLKLRHISGTTTSVLEYALRNASTRK